MERRPTIPRSLKQLLWRAQLLSGSLLLALCSAHAQSSGGASIASTSADLRATSPHAWAEAGAANQERIISAGETVPLRYRIRRAGSRGDTTREVMESREGPVARLVARDGRPLTAEEDAAERDRLNSILADPDAFVRRHKRERAGREYAVEVMHALPGAMVWTYAPGQPQLSNAHVQQIVLDFTPDAHFKPPTIVTEGLTGIAGRVWIDANTRCVLRIKLRILHPLNFGWGGMLARVSEGGTVELEQMQAAEHRWFYSHLSEHVTLREMLVHTVSEDSESSAWDAKPLHGPISVQDAVHELLAMPAPLR